MVRRLAGLAAGLGRFVAPRLGLHVPGIVGQMVVLKLQAAIEVSTPFPVNPDAASPLLTPSNRCPSWAVHLSLPPPPPLRRPPLVTVRFILVLGRPTGGPLHFNVDRR